MDSTNNLQRIPSDGDFFISAAAPFAHQEVSSPSPPPPQTRLTQMNLMAQCVRNEHQRRLSHPRDSETAVTTFSSSLSASAALSKEGLAEGQGVQAAQRAFLAPESAAQRMSFVADLTARMQEHAQQQRGRRSPSTRAIVDALTLEAGKKVVAGGSAAASRGRSLSRGFTSSRGESGRRPPRDPTHRLSSGTHSPAAQIDIAMTAAPM